MVPGVCGGERLLPATAVLSAVGKRRAQANAVHPGGELGAATKARVRFPKLVHHLLEAIFLLLTVRKIEAAHLVRNARVMV